MPLTTMWSEKLVSLDEISLNASVGGADGPPLVMLHGISRRWQDFAPLIPTFAARWQCHALDFRGHGGSGRCPGHYRVRDYSSDIVRYAKGRLTEPVIIYGHSLGALVAARVAAEWPRGVRALVLEDPPGAGWLGQLAQTSYGPLFAGFRSLAGQDRPVAEIARHLADLPVGLPGEAGKVRLGALRDGTALRFTARCLRDVDPEVFTPLLDGQWLDGYVMPEVMRAIHCPTLLLAADEKAGGMLPAQEARGLEGLIADCTRIDLPGGGHLLHWTETARTIQYVLGFLESL